MIQKYNNRSLQICNIVQSHRISYKMAQNTTFGHFTLNLVKSYKYKYNILCNNSIYLSYFAYNIKFIKDSFFNSYTSMKKIAFLFIFFTLLSLGKIQSQRHMEKLDRGLVAVRTSSTQVFLSWRILGYDPDNIKFNIYRDGVKINPLPLDGASNYIDYNSSSTSYTIKTVINGIENGEQNTSDVWANKYLDVIMDVPSELTMPDASTCTYSPNDCSVGDVDGDGQYEIFVKWDPSNAKDNSQSGYTGNVYLDCYKLDGTKLWRIDLGRNIRAGAHYTDFEVEDFDGDGKAELICKTAPGTKDGNNSYLSKGPAAFDNDAADYRTTNGYILSGPEYLTCFSGLTGEELSTVSYVPGRGSVSAWGDSYGNRVDRFLACSAYLDGVLPSAVMCRGYYTRAVLAAWDFRNGQLTQRWIYDSDAPRGANARGQGNHNLSVGDIDFDCKDEIIYGSATFDDNGTCLYSTGLGHGDALHMSDLDPDRKGLEVWQVHESTGALYGEEMHDARTGEIIWGNYTGSDNGRGMSGNIIAGNRGFEMWSSSNRNIRDKKGQVANTSSTSVNFRIYWDGDLEDELLDGTSISKYKVGTLLSVTGCSSNNSTKSTPNLSADILGDWREEVIFRTSDNKKLRIFTTTYPTEHKLYTLMHDSQYRSAIAWQNTGYNQPPHAGFYIGDDMDTAPVSAAYDNELRWMNGATLWDNSISTSWNDSSNNASKYSENSKVLFDITASANANITISGNLNPQRMKVNSPYNLTLSGDGTLNGTMDLKKNGSGSLTLNNNNHFSGNTTIWDGSFSVNGSLNNSSVFIQPFVTFSGNGQLGKDLTLSSKTIVSPGSTTGETARLGIAGNVVENGNVNYKLEISIQNGKAIAYDTVSIGGNWKLNTNTVITLSALNGTLPVGKYTLFQCGGEITGDITKLKVIGVPTYLGYSFKKEENNINLIVSQPAYLVWNGNIDGVWDNGKTSNWKIDDSNDTFTSNDSVLFNDESLLKTISITESVSPATVLFDNNLDYTMSGSGSITGTGKLIKDGTGKTTITNTNSYTGKTTVNGGTLEIPKLTDGGVASAIGSASADAANLVLNGGKLSLTSGSHSSNRNISLGEFGGSISINTASADFSMVGKFSGTGSLTKEGSGKLTMNSINTYSGNTIIKGGTIVLPTDAMNTNAFSSSDSIIFRGGTLTMLNSTTTNNTSNWNLNVPAGNVGTLNVDGNSQIMGSLSGKGTLNYFTPFTSNVLASDLTEFNGTINVTTDADGGYMLLYNTNGYSNTKFNLYNNVKMMYRVTSDITIPIGDLTGYKNSILGAGGSGPCAIIWQIGHRSANSTFNGTITDDQYSGTGAFSGIHKVGSGTWTLTNANTYSGGTKVNEGTLMVNNTAGSGLGSGDVDVNQGATLAGNGIISGKIFVYESGSLSPGNGLGTLTINNDIYVLPGATLNIDIDKTNNSSDQIITNGTLNMNGILQINFTNDTILSAGDSFKIIEGKVLGTPSEIVPAIPGDGLEWDLADFTSSGILKVKLYTSLKAVNGNTQPKVHPNPFSEYLHLDLPEGMSSKYKIVDLTGKTLVENTVNFDTTLEMGELNAGVYFIKFENSDGTSNFQKIIKQ